MGSREREPAAFEVVYTMAGERTFKREPLASVRRMQIDPEHRNSCSYDVASLPEVAGDV
jgi:hypothetical protein